MGKVKRKLKHWNKLCLKPHNTAFILWSREHEKKKFFFLVFLGLHLWHMEIPRQGRVSNWSCSWQPMPQPHQLEIWATSATYTTAHGNTRSLTHRARPGIETASSWTLVRIIFPEPQWKLLYWLFYTVLPDRPFLFMKSCPSLSYQPCAKLPLIINTVCVVGLPLYCSRVIN